MRKLKLHIRLTLDGFAAGPNGELDWMTQPIDDKMMQYVNAAADASDTLLMGRKMAEGFTEYWMDIANNHPESYEFPLAQRMVDIPKVVFTKTLEKSPDNNTVLAKGNLTEEVAKLKKKEGKDLIVYGGAGFVSSLIGAELIDEFLLFMDPVIIGNGMTIFKSVDKWQKLSLEYATPFDCGVTVLCYKPKK
ncbi:MAG TPA: dihydrofolate reductase family protein [Puia sp.]|jgi:dihydrofolate reductase